MKVRIGKHAIETVAFSGGWAGSVSLTDPNFDEIVREAAASGLDVAFVGGGIARLIRREDDAHSPDREWWGIPRGAESPADIWLRGLDPAAFQGVGLEELTRIVVAMMPSRGFFPDKRTAKEAAREMGQGLTIPCTPRMIACALYERAREEEED